MITRQYLQTGCVILSTDKGAVMCLYEGGGGVNVTIRILNGLRFYRKIGKMVLIQQKIRAKFCRFHFWMLVSVLCGMGIGFGLWSTEAAHPSLVILNDASNIKHWLGEQFIRRETTVSFRYEGNTSKLTTLIAQCLSKVLYSDPFIRFNVHKYAYKWKGGIHSATVQIYVSYRETYAQSKYVKQQAKKIVAAITKPQQSPHIKTKAIHDYIVRHVTYDKDMKKFTAYEALTAGKTVCQGYALLMQAMLEAAHISGKIIEGEAGGLLHAWNLVQLDGHWYHIDVTWDDPISDHNNKGVYTYYMRTDQEMKTDHQWKASNLIPKSTVSYNKCVVNMRKSANKELQLLGQQLAQNWSPDVLLPHRKVSQAKQLVDRYQMAKQAMSSTFQVRYTGDELALRSDIHDMVNRLHLSTPLQYRVTSLAGSQDIFVEIYLAP